MLCALAMALQSLSGDYDRVAALLAEAADVARRCGAPAEPLYGALVRQNLPPPPGHEGCSAHRISRNVAGCIGESCSARPEDAYDTPTYHLARGVWAGFLPHTWRMGDGAAYVASAYPFSRKYSSKHRISTFAE